MNVKQQEKGLMGSFSSWHNIVAACLDHSLCQEEQGKERCRKIDIQSTLSCPVLWFMILVSDSWWAWRAVAVCTACCTSVTQPRSACQAASCRNCVTARSSTASWHCTANSPCRLIKQSRETFLVFGTSPRDQKRLQIIDSNFDFSFSWSVPT